MQCIHVAKEPSQKQADITIESTGVKHTLCMSCLEVFQNCPRKSPVESVSYHLYRSPQPDLPKEQWIRINEKPIPPTENGKVQYRLENIVPDGSEYYVTAINAIGLESAATKMKSVDAPRVVVKSVVLFGETTDEGKLIKAVTIPWFEIIELLRNDPNAAFQIPAQKWEEIIAGAYHRAGFDEVTLTPRSGDYGRDVIAVKKGIGTIRIIDQVKAYKPGHLVDANDVRAIVGVLQGDGASKAFLRPRQILPRNCQWTL